MIGSKDSALKEALKKLIVEVCESEEEADSISDDEALFGSDSVLGLDSMDALQISMALDSQYGLKTTDSKKLRKMMTSINTLADFIQPV
jgi:acyl carrier protein